jgi:hypothetical protein
MRGYGWKISLIAITFCYPVGNLLGRLVEYIGLKSQKDPITSDQVQMLRLGNGVLVTFIIIGWLIAFVSGMESWGADDDLERKLSRFVFIMVLIVTVVFLADFGLGREIQALT